MQNIDTRAHVNIHMPKKIGISNNSKLLKFMFTFTHGIQLLKQLNFHVMSPENKFIFNNFAYKVAISLCLRDINLFLPPPED